MPRKPQPKTEEETEAGEVMSITMLMVRVEEIPTRLVIVDAAGNQFTLEPGTVRGAYHLRPVPVQ